MYQQPEGYISSHERENIKDNKGNGEFGEKRWKIKDPIYGFIVEP
ncbi:hypothetical protein J2Z80_002384 [Thermoanaerobacterium butyriciformans]|uniref:Uncharacterized protein n=1 Tax=Thermoanaerobacterium butyriciformans TaxID=1702242 RepID=A0ABS4NGN5_9THEO|nr:hypothetical protein [Thermoanaerobacterium butyriciformans]